MEATNGQLHDLVTRIDERVVRLQTDLREVGGDLAAFKVEQDRRREADQADRRRDRFTLMGIAIALGGVAVSVIALIGHLG